MRSGNTVRGFTLIEVMVVVVIVGVISAVALLSFGVLGDDRSLQQNARRLSSLIELSSEEALMQGREFGLEFTRTGYRFLEFDPLSNRWHEVAGDDLLRPRQLEEELELELTLEGREVTLGERFSETKSQDEDDSEGTLEEDYAPHVLIMSSGDVTPFVLHIVRPVDRSEIVVDTGPAGEMRIRSGDEVTS